LEGCVYRRKLINNHSRVYILVRKWSTPSLCRNDLFPSYMSFLDSFSFIWSFFFLFSFFLFPFFFLLHFHPFSLPLFHIFSLNDIVWRDCNLTPFSPCLTGPVDYLFASRHKGPRFKSPGGYLCETVILPLALSRYICDPDVIYHYFGLVWGGPRPEPSLGPRADNVIIPLDLTQLSCPGFKLAAGLPSSFTTDGVGCWGGALWKACNLTPFSPCLTGPVDYLFASRHKEPRFKSPGEYLCETWILLLALSRYNWLIFSLPLGGGEGYFQYIDPCNRLELARSRPPARLTLRYESTLE
jgi:hypothetical protein